MPADHSARTGPRGPPGLPSRRARPGHSRRSWIRSRPGWTGRRTCARRKSRSSNARSGSARRSAAAKPFVEPEPTRMDWAKNLREAEKQELGRQTSEREARPPAPAPVAPAALSAHRSLPGRSHPGRAYPAARGGEQAAPATRAERVQQPADATRAEKIITAKPGDETTAARQGPAAPRLRASASAVSSGHPGTRPPRLKRQASGRGRARRRPETEPAADSGAADASRTDRPGDPG